MDRIRCPSHVAVMDIDVLVKLLICTHGSKNILKKHIIKK